MVGLNPNRSVFTPNMNSEDVPTKRQFIRMD